MLRNLLICYFNIPYDLCVAHGFRGTHFRERETALYFGIVKKRNYSEHAVRNFIFFFLKPLQKSFTPFSSSSKESFHRDKQLLLFIFCKDFNSIVSSSHNDNSHAAQFFMFSIIEYLHNCFLFFFLKTIPLSSK